MRFGSYLNKKVRQCINFLDRRLDDIPVENFEHGVLILVKSHEFSESFYGDKRRFALMPGDVEIVETDFPQNQGVSARELVLQT